MKRKLIKNQLDKNNVDSNDEIVSDLVHFARLAAAGDSEGAKIYGMRRVRELMTSNPGLAHGLRSALVAAPKGSSNSAAPLRRAEPAWESAATETESGIDFLRIETRPTPSVPPLYAPNVQSALLAIIAEHQSPELLIQEGLAPTKSLLLSGPPAPGF